MLHTKKETMPESLIICNNFFITNYEFLYFAKTYHNDIMKKSTCYLNSRAQFFIQLSMSQFENLQIGTKIKHRKKEKVKIS